MTDPLAYPLAALFWVLVWIALDVADLHRLASVAALLAGIWLGNTEYRHWREYD